MPNSRVFIKGNGINIHGGPNTDVDPIVGQGEDGNPMDIDTTIDDGQFVPDCGSIVWSHGVVTRTDLNPPVQVTGWVSSCFLRA